MTGEESPIGVSGCSMPGGRAVVRGLLDMGYRLSDAGDETADRGACALLVGGVPVGRERVRAWLSGSAGGLGQWLLHRQRRDAGAGKHSRGSAEALVLAGMTPGRLGRPEADIVLRSLGRLIEQGLEDSGKPFPRLCRFPNGHRSLMAFSFDDFCPSGKPLRRALKSRNGRAALAELRRYPGNAGQDTAELCRLFSGYEARGTAFVLPAWTGLKNVLRVAGYWGVGHRVVAGLADAGWDVATHLKPRRMSEYAVLKEAFERRFGFSPSGHRGHELGWVGWTEDWEQLDALGYAYDSTWCWGGHEGVAWPTGTAAPCAATDAEGRALSLLEIPANVWLEDLIPLGAEQAVRRIDASLDRYPGLYHVAGHSWAVREPAYRDVLDALLDLARRRDDVGGILSLKDVASFWRARALSGPERPSWDESTGTVRMTMRVDAAAEELSAELPARWNGRVLTAIRCAGRDRTFRLRERDGRQYAVWSPGAGVTDMELFYRDATGEKEASGR